MNKENNNHQKDLSQEEEKKDSSSLSAKKDSSINLSPESNSFNQKFFPSKENFFGVKASPNKINGKIVGPRNHSPILNYFSGLSPKNKDNYPSPKEGLVNQNNNNNNLNKLSPLNFNYSPSTIFNAPNDKEITNFSLHNTGNYEEDNKTLQEFLRKTDTNNFLRANSLPSNSSNSQENKNEENNDDEEEDDEGEETLTLAIDSSEEDYLLGKNKYKPYNEMNHTIFKNMNNHNDLNNNIVCNDNINNNNDGLNNNNILNNNNFNNSSSHNYGNSIKVNNINENGKILQLLNIKENQINIENKDDKDNIKNSVFGFELERYR